MTANIGDEVYLSTILVNLHCFGRVTDIDTPPQVRGSFELVGREAVLDVPVLKGDKGDKGEPADIVKLVYGHGLTSPDELPTDLKRTDADIGTAYWIDNLVYIWSGIEWDVRQMGSAGPAGPPPDVSPTIESIPWEDQQAGAVSEIIVGGTVARPTWHFKIAAPRGDVGPSTNILHAPDFDNSTPPTAGQVIVWNGTKFAAEDPNPFASRMYTVPESSFQSVPLVIGTKVPVLTIEIPVQPQDFNLWVVGHMRVNGFEINIFDPFLITSEVRVAAANTDPKGGVLVARGFGNSSQIMHVMPHASTPQSPSDSITPDDGSYGRFAANTQYTLSMMLQTSGLLGVYNFQPRDAQLAFQVIPV